MAYSYKFPTTLPIDITFFNAESLSPTKLNNIFNYLKLANTSIEMYLGNGIDYNVTDSIRKKVIGNLSNIIGDVAGNVYMPYNYFGTIYSIYKEFCSTFNHVGSVLNNNNQHAIYFPANDSIEILEAINIPVGRMFSNQVKIGIHYSITSDASPSYNDISCSIYTITANGLEDSHELPIILLNNLNGFIPSIIKNNSKIINVKDVTIDANTFISHITLSNTKQSNVHFYIHSLFLYEITSEENGGCVNKVMSTSTSSTAGIPLNSFYSLGKNHKSLYVCKQPCKYSSASYNTEGNLCPLNTVQGLCIGNTYDVFIDNGQDIEDKKGLPVCGGYERVVNGKIVDDTLVANRDVSFVYRYDTTYSATPPQFYILQSPLLTYYDKPYSFKYTPLSMVRNNIGITKTSECLIYNYQSTSNNPIFYDAIIETSTRADIVKVSNIAMTTSNNKYLFLSSDIGISQMMNAMIKKSNSVIGRSVAVYAD